MNPGEKDGVIEKRITVFKADVAGAASTALGTAAMNAVPGAGQLAYGATILGATATASSASALKQLWDHWF